MKQQIISFSIAFLAFSSTVQAQTKMISYKSHSGSSMHWEQAIKLDLFSLPNSNLGAAPERIIYNAQLDSLIFLDDTSTVMVTSDRCYNLDSNRAWSRKRREIWRAGRDTVFHHNTFNRNLPVDSIREIVKTSYHFANDADDIVMVDHQFNPSEHEPAGTEKATDKKKNPKQARNTKKKKQFNRTKKNRNAKKGLWKKPGCTIFILSLFLVTLGMTYKRKTNR